MPLLPECPTYIYWIIRILLSFQLSHESRLFGVENIPEDINMLDI